MMRRDQWLLIDLAIEDVLEAKKVLTQKMSLDNNPINLNDSFFDSLKRELKNRLTESLN